MSNVVFFVVVISLPLIFGLTYAKIGKNLNESETLTKDSQDNLTAHDMKKTSLMKKIKESHYKNFMTEENIKGKEYICLNIPLKNFKDITIEAIFFNNFKGVMVNILNEIRPEFDNIAWEVCCTVNNQIFANEQENSTCVYSYGFGYKNGSIFGYLPTNEAELNGETIEYDEAVKGIERLIYYAEEDLIPMFLNRVK